MLISLSLGRRRFGGRGCTASRLAVQNSIGFMSMTGVTHFLPKLAGESGTDDEESLRDMCEKALLSESFFSRGMNTLGKTGEFCAVL